MAGGTCVAPDRSGAGPRTHEAEARHFFCFSGVRWPLPAPGAAPSATPLRSSNVVSSGVIVRCAPGGRPRELCRTWPNQHEITVPGIHFVQEDAPDQIGTALAAWLRELP